MSRLTGFIYYQPSWPAFTWQEGAFISTLAEVRHLQGMLSGKMEALGFKLRNEVNFDSLQEEVLKTNEIEGEILKPEQVRSSIAVRLGMDIGGLISTDRNVDGAVDMLLDATRAYDSQLTTERLFKWHRWLFPGRPKSQHFIIGNWRNDSTGPMQVISGAIGKEKVHFQAPDAKNIPQEMNQFLSWFNDEDSELDGVLKASIAHLWFVTIHPFEDGNGRMARAIADLALSKSENQNQKFYSMSRQIRIQRKAYYEILESTQKGDLDITKWITWFLDCLKKSLEFANDEVQKIMAKHRFWLENQNSGLNARQIKIIELLFTKFKGKLTSTKWAKICKCSHDTALRDIHDLISRDILKKEKAGGRSTSYKLKIRVAL